MNWKDLIWLAIFSGIIGAMVALWIGPALVDSSNSSYPPVIFAPPYVPSMPDP